MYENPYTEKQIKILAILPMVVCPLSFLGSGTILYMLRLRGERRLYHHLIFMISVIDILTSLVGMLGPIPVPESINVVFARGNTATCEMQGFFSHLTIGNLLYNMFLMISFVKIVRYGAKEDALSAQYETFIHIFSTGFPILTGVAGIVLNIFNPVLDLGFTRCYIAAYPPGCDIEIMATDNKDDTQQQQLVQQEDCTRGANARKFLALFTMMPLLISLIILFGSIFLVCYTVRQNDHRSRQLSQHNIRNMNRTISMQAAIYGIVFFNTYVWMMIDPIIALLLPQGGKSTFRGVVRFLAETFYGSQGFFNFLVYIRPRYIRIRSYRQDQSAGWALQEAIFGLKLEDMRYRSTEVIRNQDKSSRRSNVSQRGVASYNQPQQDYPPSTTTPEILGSWRNGKTSENQQQDGDYYNNFKPAHSLSRAGEKSPIPTGDVSSESTAMVSQSFRLEEDPTAITTSPTITHAAAAASPEGKSTSSRSVRIQHDGRIVISDSASKNSEDNSSSEMSAKIMTTMTRTTNAATDVNEGENSNSVSISSIHQEIGDEDDMG